MDTITRPFYSCLLVFGILLIMGDRCHGSSNIRQIDTSVLQSMMEQDDNLYLINVLPKIIHDNKHIPGSKNIPLGKIREANALPDSLSATLVFYCMGLL